MLEFGFPAFLLLKSKWPRANKDGILGFQL
jgi:hypothetical protein